MADKESDVIEHLLELEQEAASLLMEAQTTADKRISEARAKADEIFKKEYSSLISSADANLAEECDKINKKHDEAFSAYKDRISNTEKDIPAFNTLLDKLLFAE